MSSSKAVNGTQGVSAIMAKTWLKVSSSILGSGEGSDLKVECDGILWTVHSVLLSIQSRFFQAACTGNFKVCISSLIFDSKLIRVIGKHNSYHSVARRTTWDG